MHVVTFGAYQFYWFYRQWGAVRDYNHLYISPAARSVVSPIFAYNLFYRVLAASGLQPAKAFGIAAALGTFLLGTSIAAQMPPPYLLLCTVAVIPAIPIQALANRAIRTAAPDHPINSRLSRLNWVAVAIGGSALSLIALGTVLRH